MAATPLASTPLESRGSRVSVAVTSELRSKYLETLDLLRQALDENSDLRDRVSALEVRRDQMEKYVLCSRQKPQNCRRKWRHSDSSHGSVLVITQADLDHL
jgi:hypothetical protein